MDVRKLPKSLTTVTTFSKLLALFLFILFPYVGFYLGMQYQDTLNTAKVTPLPSPTKAPKRNEVLSSNNCELKDKSVAIQELPLGWECAVQEDPSESSYFTITLRDPNFRFHFTLSNNGRSAPCEEAQDDGDATIKCLKKEFYKTADFVFYLNHYGILGDRAIWGESISRTKPLWVNIEVVNKRDSLDSAALSMFKKMLNDIALN